MIVTTTFQRKTFRVQAIQVTADNMADLSEWCGGTLKNDHETNAPYILVPSGSRGNMARAYAKDWITSLGAVNNFRVYKNKTFLEAFEEIRNSMDRHQDVRSLVIEAMGGNTWNFGAGGTVQADELTAKICNLF